MILEMKNVTKYFGKRKVLDNVSVTVKEGEILGFLGPNGAGKTTAIKIMLGLLNASSGEVFINGFSVNKNFEKALEKVGGIIESPDMYNYLSGYDNLMLCARMHGLGKKRVLEVAEQVKLLGRLNDKVKKYSLGMRQRLGVAQALINKPNFLVLDEPTNGLDPVGIKELRDMLRELAKSGTAVFVSSHLLAEMELMCDTLCIIEQGVVVTQKSLSELITEQDLENRFNYTLSVSPADKALSLLIENGYDTTAADDLLHIKATKEKIAEIVKLLVLNEVSLYSMTAEQKSLEKAFLEATNGSKGQIA
ncbi:MAG: bacitracin ABC transporter ATP-binding protein [Clostridiales bacterium GWF2_36_10]|nr:MAG: bacitracin ABC transporter ATP-binding protein [Clostridiales bacterium GWF2_36_10]HAN20819.1 bacitracin ABC transporter ATP-binding protein [Clostridiales bacterium]